MRTAPVFPPRLLDIYALFFFFLFCGSFGCVIVLAWFLLVSSRLSVVLRRSPRVAGPDPALELLRSRVLALAAESDPARRKAYETMSTCVVWAKFQAYPWWPAQLVQLARLPETGATFKRIADSWVEGTVLVAFYGKKREYSWMPPDRIKPFEGSVKQHLPTNKKHKHYRPILAAVKAAETAIKMGPPRFSNSPLPAYISASTSAAGVSASGSSRNRGSPADPGGGEERGKSADKAPPGRAVAQSDRGRPRKQVQRWSADPLAVADLGGSADKHAAVVSPPSPSPSARGQAASTAAAAATPSGGGSSSSSSSNTINKGRGRYSFNDAPYAMLRDCLNDEMATAIVAARKKQPFVSVGDCVSRIRKLGRTKLLKLEGQNISIPRQPPGRKPKDYKPPVGGGGAVGGTAGARGQKRKGASRNDGDDQVASEQSGATAQEQEQEQQPKKRRGPGRPRIHPVDAQGKRLKPPKPTPMMGPDGKPSSLSEASYKQLRSCDLTDLKANNILRFYQSTGPTHWPKQWNGFLNAAASWKVAAAATKDGDADADADGGSKRKAGQAAAPAAAAAAAAAAAVAAGTGTNLIPSCSAKTIEKLQNSGCFKLP